MKFSGAFYPIRKDMKELIPFICDATYISQVVYNNPATIVFWNDGTKTIAKCHPNDTYSKEYGLLMCIHKKMFGKDNFKEIMADWITDSDVVTLKQVRQKYKDNERNIE